MGEKMTLADAAIRFLSGRKGFDGWWDAIDDDVQQELRAELQAELTAHLTQPAQAVDVGVLSWLPAELHILAFGDELDDMTTGEAYHAGWNECLDAIKRHRTRALPNALKDTPDAAR